MENKKEPRVTEVKARLNEKQNQEELHYRLKVKARENPGVLTKREEAMVPGIQEAIHRRSKTMMQIAEDFGVPLEIVREVRERYLEMIREEVEAERTMAQLDFFKKAKQMRDALDSDRLADATTGELIRGATSFHNEAAKIKDEIKGDVHVQIANVLTAPQASLDVYDPAGDGVIIEGQNEKEG